MPERTLEAIKTLLTEEERWKVPWETPRMKGGPFEILIKSPIFHMKTITTGAIEDYLFIRENIFSEKNVTDYNFDNDWVTIWFLTTDGDKEILMIPREQCGPVFIGHHNAAPGSSPEGRL
jgi:hypothetical protein